MKPIFIININGWSDGSAIVVGDADAPEKDAMIIFVTGETKVLSNFKACSYDGIRDCPQVPFEKALLKLQPGVSALGVAQTVRNYLNAPPPMKVGEYQVTFSEGFIQVGCTKVTNDEIREIAKRQNIKL